MHHVFYKETDFFNKHIKDDAEKVKDHKNANAELIKLGDNAKTINVNEYIIIVSHGSRPNFFFNSFFCGHSADSLASIVFKYLPRNYSGKIYLDGCHTAEPYKGLGDGTSFVERFGTALKSLLKTVENSHGQFKVKGNLGPAATGKSDGTEWIEEDKVNTSWIQQAFNERFRHKIEDDVAFDKFYNKYKDSIIFQRLEGMTHSQKVRELDWFKTKEGKNHIRNWLQTDYGTNIFFNKVIRDFRNNISEKFAHKTYSFTY